MNWIVLETPSTISETQLNVLLMAMASNGARENNRPVQPLNGRSVYRGGEQRAAVVRTISCRISFPLPPLTQSASGLCVAFWLCSHGVATTDPVY